MPVKLSLNILLDKCVLNGVCLKWRMIFQYFYMSYIWIRKNFMYLISCSRHSRLWHYRLWSFKARYTKLERFLHKINISKGYYWIFRIGLMGSLSSSQNQSFKSWLFHSSIIFGAKIEISGTKWVEKTSIYFFSTFGSKINAFERK